MNVRATYLSSAIVLLSLQLLSTSSQAVVQGEPVVDKSITQLTAEEAAGFVEEIIPVVEELRGLKFKRPVPVKLTDDEGAREYMLRRIEAFQTREQIRDVARAYALLGLLPEGIDILELYLETMRDEAGGFYDPESGSYYLMKDVPLEMGPMIAAHELTHALEDQYFSLDDRLRAVIDDDDQLLARAAIHEGSATLLMFAYLARAALNEEVDPEALMAYADAETARTSALNDLPDLLKRQLIAPYLLGASFLARGNMLAAFAGGFPVDDVNLAYKDVPLSSEQILHPAKYWDEEKRDEPVGVSLGQAGEALGPRWKKRLDGVLGEMSLGVMVGAPTPGLLDGLTVHIGTKWTNDAATGWDGDRWELWMKGERAIVLLATVWDSEADAEEFVTAIGAQAGLDWALSGNRVAVVAGDAGGKTEQLLTLILDAP
jgi:hypothetical protein